VIIANKPESFDRFNLLNETTYIKQEVGSIIDIQHNKMLFLN